LLTVAKEKEIRGQRLPILPSLDSLLKTSYDVDWLQSANISNVYGKKQKRRPLPPRTGARDFTLPVCTCPPRYAFKDYQYLSRAVSLFYSKERYEIHLPQYPFYTCPKQVRKLGARFHSAGYLLSTAILATISINTGASGFSINPQLSFRAVVPSNSPAFALFSLEYYGKSPSYRSVGDQCLEFATDDELLESIMPKLLRLFAERRASPTDVNEFGQSLLHVKPHILLFGCRH
jgi:hypothetical protein